MLSTCASGQLSPRTQTGGAERKLVLKLATGSKRAVFSRITQKMGQQRHIYIVVQPRQAVQGAGDGYIRANANAMRAIERETMRSRMRERDEMEGESVREGKVGGHEEAEQMSGSDKRRVQDEELRAYLHTRR